MLEQVHLIRGADRGDDLERLFERHGTRVGLEGVLEDLDRRARWQPVPGRAVTYGFALDLADTLTPRWWPQGITTSADHDTSEQSTGRFAGREVVLTSSYAKSATGGHDAARITVFDTTGRGHRVRYRHIRLVEVSTNDDSVALKQVPVHAGGIVWRGDQLHVAGTARGLFTFDLRDVVRLRTPIDGDAYALPLRHVHRAETVEGFDRMRYSFLSLDRSGERPELLAGEYGRGEQTTRLIRYPLEDNGAIACDESGIARPIAFDLDGIVRMQGAVRVGGRFYISQSRGRTRRGHLHVGSAGDLSPVECALPPGPEDLSYMPSTDELWCPAEHPFLRYVVAVDRGSLAN